MTADRLTISGHDKVWQVEPNAAGTVIGRGSMCDLTLEAQEVSREHARIFKDPFGRWIIEDLGSSNGVVVDGNRVQSHAFLPGESIVIGTFTLFMTQPLGQPIEPDDSVRTTATITEDGFETQIISGKGPLDSALSGTSLRKLDEIAEQLSGLTSCSGLYREVCRSLARSGQEVAIVLRLPHSPAPLPASPQVLACHWGGPSHDTSGQADADPRVSPLALRLSGHVLEFVRETRSAASANTVFSSDAEMTWSVVDAHSPRTIVCAPLDDVTESVDLLYLDIPVDSARPDVVEFVQAVARQVDSRRKILELMQARVQRSVLDCRLSLAQRIQSGLTPTVPKDLGGVDLALCYKPVTWVGGDYCDVWSLEDGRLAFVVADVCEKGLPAALAMISLKTALRTAVTFCSQPSEIINHLNRHLMRNMPAETLVTLFLGLFDPQDGGLEYVNAGHPQPLIIGPKPVVVPLGASNDTPIGVADAHFRAGSQSIQGAKLLVFTDGLTQARSPDGKVFGQDRLGHLLRTADDRSARGITNLATKAVKDFRKSCTQLDDITVLCLGES